jgi:hypothetical protein
MGQEYVQNFPGRWRNGPPLESFSPVTA